MELQQGRNVQYNPEQIMAQNLNKKPNQIYCITSMSGTSNERLPLLTGNKTPLRRDIDHGK